MKKNATVAKADLDQSTDMRDLFSVQLQRLAGLSSRIAALVIPQHFSITVLEWRTIAILDYLGEAPLVRVAKHAGVLKSQMSRLVTSLSKRELIERQPNPEDGRSALLCLSPSGKDLVRRVLDDSQARNEAMLNGLSNEEREQLKALMDRIYANSLSYFGELKRHIPYDQPEDEDIED
ncbi:MarR family winged helix-turn-helix transcriptional regulator [Pseudomonas monteilii]|uniref:MarR family transcriptional regulator n=1 Tax=Pseudomonas monteilii TaxID=76759 RepID=A0A399LY48_9PSED|nr:MarR family winged helix-turn-helix transcriptional regulator [Pseudomonas monteilii]RII74322.1 MarR family transcriptional regulator [Pseudomonas monteilii]